jgi:hypothetical protein
MKKSVRLVGRYSPSIQENASATKHAHSSAHNPCELLGENRAIERKDYDGNDDFTRSIEEAYRVIRERKKNGGKGWGGWE